MKSQFQFKVFPKLSSKFKIQNKGFTLLEVLVSSVIIGIVFFSFVTSVVFMGNNVKVMEAQTTRGELSSTLMTHLRNPSVLINSAEATGNLSLRNCINGAAADSCTHLQEIEFELRGSVKDKPVLDGGGDPVLDGFGQPLFEGTQLGGGSGVSCSLSPGQARPQFYTLQGRPCACEETSRACPLQLITSFVPACASGATCQRALAYSIKYQIKVRPDLPEDIKNQTLAVFRPEQGEKVIDLSLDDEFFVQFSRVSIFDLVSGTPPSEVLFQGLTRSQIRQGVSLTYRDPGRARFEIIYNSPTPVQRVEVFRYIYPSECSLSNLGTISSCNLPEPSSFVSVVSVLTHGSLNGTVQLLDSLTAVGDRVIDYRLRTYTSANHVIMESLYDLRLYAHDPGSLSVTPPISITHSCVPPNPANNFVFQANSINGWDELSAEFNPPLNIGGVPQVGFPNFSTNFNKTLSSPQSLSINNQYFVPNSPYQITFFGKTKAGLIASTQGNFTVPPRPILGFAGFPLPVNNSLIRPISPLVVSFSLNLDCGETLNEVNLLTQVGTTTYMPNKDIKSSCIAAPPVPDNGTNIYNCNVSLPCEEWLNVAEPALCSTVFSALTNLTLRASFVGSSGASGTQDVTLRVSPKLGLTIDRNSVQFIQLRASGFPRLGGATLPVRVNFQSALQPSDSVELSLKGATIDSSHTCRRTGSINATYNTTGNYCTLNMKVPSPIRGDSVVLESLNPDLYEVNGESVVTILEYGESQLSCASSPTAPVCPAGQVLKTAISPEKGWSAGTYSGSEFWTDFWTDPVNRVLTDYTLKNPTSKLEFFSIVKPVYDPTKPGISPLVKVEKRPTLDSYYGVDLALPVSERIRCESVSRCPTRLIRWPASLFEPSKTDFISTPFKIIYTLNAAGQENPGVRLVLIRECYCE